MPKLDARAHRSTRQRPLAAVLCLACLPTAALSQSSGLFVAPATFSATVQENLLPGGSVHNESQVVDTGQPGAPASADLLYLTSAGSNFSGRDRNITSGFASAQADVTGNGGVGVTNWLATNPGPAGSQTTQQLVGQALWTQTFTNTGSTDIALSMSFHVPAMEVGLIGVPPNRSAPSATETASAEVALSTSINRADGTLVAGKTFSFGLQAVELQLPLGPGTYANFASANPILTGDNLGFNPFAGFHDNGNASVPLFSLDALSFSEMIGTLHPGDILSYVYTLTAVGTTHGSEQGFQAFLGDPFSLGASGGSIGVSVAAVPEPGTLVQLLAGLAMMTSLLLRRRARRRLPPA